MSDDGIELHPQSVPDTIEEYDGATFDECEYECSSKPRYYVEIEGAAFVACRDCLNAAGMYPIDNGWCVNPVTGRERGGKG